MEGGLVVRSLEGLWCPSGRMVLDKGLEIIVDELRYMLHLEIHLKTRWVCQVCLLYVSCILCPYLC